MKNILGHTTFALVFYIIDFHKPSGLPRLTDGFSFLYIGVQIGTSVADYIEQEKTGAAKLTS